MKNIFLLLASLYTFPVYSQQTPCDTSPLFYDTSNHIPILMNEILPEGANGETWVEFYNCRQDTVDLSGWFLTNDPMDSLKFPIPIPYLVAPEEFKVLSLPFTISRSFGLLQLWRPDSTMAYGMTFDGVRVGESVGFCGDMIMRQMPSPGVENTCLDFETGIIETSFGNGDTQYYDLFGRLVQNIQEGLFIRVQKGMRKKVFVVR